MLRLLALVVSSCSWSERSRELWSRSASSLLRRSWLLRLLDLVSCDSRSSILPACARSCGREGLCLVTVDTQQSYIRGNRERVGGRAGRDGRSTLPAALSLICSCCRRDSLATLWSWACSEATVVWLSSS